MSLLKKLACILALLSTCHIESLEMIAAQREGDGVGYKNQYSKFSIYHAFENSSWQPFIDARYLLLNHGKNGANLGTGLGYQFEKENRLTGYAYFDLTESKTGHYFNQITAGFSYTHPLLVSGKDYGEFTCYFNGYFPIKDREKNVKAPSFAKFKGNHLIINQTDRLALTGTNLELGYLSSYWKDFNLYVAGSGYYFEKSSLDAFGGYGKLRVTYNDLIHAEVMVSGDRLFGTNVSGTFGIRIPLDAKGMKAVKTKTPRLHRLRPVERFEPMILYTEKRKVIAKDSCGKALNYIFVNNLCGSCGTFESPFATLLEAQNASKPGDTIYVFRGDGTTSGMDMGIAMQDEQTLAGSGSQLRTSTQLGFVTIPALTACKPQITNLAGNGVTLATNNTLSGLIINGATENGIALDSTVRHPSTINIFSCEALNSEEFGLKIGDFVISSNALILNISNSKFAYNKSGGLQGVTNETPLGSSTATAIVTINNSDFSNNFSTGMIWFTVTKSSTTLDITNSNFNDNMGGGLFFSTITSNVAINPLLFCNMTSCNFINNTITGFSSAHNEHSITDLNLNYCSAQMNGSTGFRIATESLTKSKIKFNFCSATNNLIGCQLADGVTASTNIFYNKCIAKNNTLIGYRITAPSSTSNGTIERSLGSENTTSNFDITSDKASIVIENDTTLSTDF